MSIRTVIPAITIETHGNGIAALARLKVGDHVVYYSGGSRYSDTLVQDLEMRLAQTLEDSMVRMFNSDSRQVELAERWESEVD